MSLNPITKAIRRRGRQFRCSGHAAGRRWLMTCVLPTKPANRRGTPKREAFLRPPGECQAVGFDRHFGLPQRGHVLQPSVAVTQERLRWVAVPHGHQR